MNAFNHLLNVPVFWPMMRVVGFGFALALAYFTSVIVYNIFLHPLRRFPGPILAAATPLYWTVINIRGKRHLAADAWHEKYGEIVRVTPNQLSFISEGAWKDIYMHKQGRPQLQKVERGRPIDGKYSILNAPDDDVHARQRKMLAHAFSDKALREQEPLFRTYIDLLMSNLRNEARQGRPVDIVAWLNYATFDIIGDLSFNESFHNLELRRSHPWLTTVFSMIRTATILNSFLVVPGFFFFFRMFAKFLFPQRFEMVKHAKERIERRIQQGSDRPDFMSKVLPHLKEDGTGISKAELTLTTVVLIIAGSETTATLLSGCAYLLMRNPSVLEKLQKEVRTSFESVEEIDLINVNRLPYLLAVIEESLRVYPPVPISLPRRMNSEGGHVCGHWIPGGCAVGVSQRAAYRSPLNFVDSTSFIPERWLPDRPSRFEKDKRGVVQPFSTGPRNCLGKNLAYAEMKLILATLIYEFNFRMVDESHQWDNQRVFNLYEKHPLMLWMEERS